MSPSAPRSESPPPESTRVCVPLSRPGHAGTAEHVCTEWQTHRVYDRRVAEFVPPDFEVPAGLETSEFVLEPLGPEHNEQDYRTTTPGRPRCSTSLRPRGIP